MIISILYIILYLFTCWITMRGLFRISSAGNLQSRSNGFILLLIGAVGRFIVLYIAWTNDFPLSYAIIAQFLPLISVILMCINFAINDYKRDVTS